MYDTVKVKPVVMCPDEVRCPLRCRSPVRPRRIQSPRCPPRRHRRRSCKRTNCQLVPMSGMGGGMGGMGGGMGGMGGMMGGMGGMMGGMGGMMGGMGGMMGGIGGIPSSPQMGFGGGNPVSLMPDGRRCITFPYGNNLITNIQGMQGMPLPGHMMYNNNCFQ